MFGQEEQSSHLTLEATSQHSAPIDFNKTSALMVLFGVVAFVHLPGLVSRVCWVANGRSKNDFVVLIFLPGLTLYIGLLCLIVLLRTRRQLMVFDCKWWRWTRSELIRLPLLPLGMLIVLFVSIALMKVLRLPKGASLPLRSFHSIGFLLWFAIISLAVLNPIFEEVFWRGYVQATLVRVFGPWVGILGQALLFGLLHLSSPTSTVVKASLGGLLFGVWCYKRKTLIPVIVMHAASNSVAIVSMFSGYLWR